MLEEHGGFPEDTPRLTTGNGGMHVLFSLSQSAEAGLRNCANREKIRYQGERVGIDTRGRGGMLYTAPSSYVGLDGRRRSYEWDQEILPDRSNLRAVPEWLISILHESDEAPSEDGGGGDGGYVLKSLNAPRAQMQAVSIWSPESSSRVCPSCPSSRAKFSLSRVADVNVKPL